MTAPPDLRPLRLGEVIDVAARLTRRNFAALVTVLAVLVLWIQVVATVVAFVTADDVVVVDGEPFYLYADQAAEDQAALLTGALALAGGLGSLAALAGMLRLVGRRYVTGTAPAWGEAAGYGLRRIHSVLWIGILAVIAVALVGLGMVILSVILGAVAGSVGALVGVALLFGVAISMYTRLSLAFPSLTEEGLRGSTAIRRSWQLVRGRFWPIFGALVLALVIIIAVQAGVGVALVGVLQLDSVPLVLALTTLLNLVAEILVFPFLAATLIVIYYDQRVRKEGLDLELQAQSLGAPGPAPAAPRSRPAAATRAEGFRPLDTPPPPGFIACTSCGRHVAADTVQCPYCQASLR